MKKIWYAHGERYMFCSSVCDVHAAQVKAIVLLCDVCFLYITQLAKWFDAIFSFSVFGFGRSFMHFNNVFFLRFGSVAWGEQIARTTFISLTCAIPFVPY